MEFSGGVPLWQHKDFEIQGPPVPVTPAKPVPMRRPLNPTNGQRRMAPSSNWFETIDNYAGFHGGLDSQEGVSSGSYGLTDQICNLNNSRATALPSAGQFSVPQSRSHNVGSSMMAIGQPPDGWKQDTYRELIAFPNGAPASKVTFFTPPMPGQIGRSQQMPVPTNQLLLNGRVLLNPRFCSASNSSQIHTSQTGLPVPLLPRFNALPGKAVSMGMDEHLFSSSICVPMEKNKSVQDHRPCEIIDLVDDGADERNIQEEVGRWQHSDLRQTVVSAPNSVMLSQVGSSEEQQCGENAVVSTKELSAQRGIMEDQGTGENQGIDLNKTPQQKPKRKKHRPKVIKEGKPAKTPKPRTPKPVTPKPAINKEEKPTGKRKYVRKKKDQNSTVEPPVSGEVADSCSGSGIKSVRRCLNFDNEDPPARNGCPGPTLTSTNNEQLQAREACDMTTTTNLAANSNLQLPHGQGLADKLPAGVTFDLNSSINQIQDVHASFAENTQTCSRVTMRTNQMLDGCRRMPEYPMTPPRFSKRDALKENLNELARKNDSLTISSSGTSPEAGLNHLDSYLLSNTIVKGTKRDHNLVDGTQALSSASIQHGYNQNDMINGCHDVRVQGSYLTENYKRKKLENDYSGQTNVALNASSSVTHMPSSNWKTNQVPLSNSEAFMFAYAQRLMALEKMRASDYALSFEQAESYSTRTSLPVQAHNPPSVSATGDNNDCIAAPEKQFRCITTNCTQLPTPTKPSGWNNSLQGGNCQPQLSIEAAAENTKEKAKTRRRARKEKVHPVNMASSKTCHEDSQKHENTSCVSQSPSQIVLHETASTSGTYREKHSLLQNTQNHDSEGRSNLKGLSGANVISGVTVPCADPLDAMIQKMKCLDINRAQQSASAQVQNALVPYEGGAMVPYEGPFELLKKRRSRAKVDLDPETNRVWKLLMGKEASDGVDGMDKNKEKWWEEERRIFRGRVDSFIARMHLVQGDRRFSQWKGSVVDSVVGVFLTQNVSDHLSSSAFMALAAKFPVKPRGDGKPGAEIMGTHQKEECISSFEDASKWQEKILGKEMHDRGSLVATDEKEGSNGNESLGSNTEGIVVDSSKGKCSDAHENELNTGHESPDSGPGTPVTVTGSTSIAEAEDRRSVEDVVSSQNSVVSSQNSSDYLFLTADRIGLSSSPNFGTEQLIYGSISNGMESSTSFTELLRIAETRSKVIDNISSSEHHSAATNLKGADPSLHSLYSYLQNGQHAPMNVSYPPDLDTSFNLEVLSTNDANVLQCENGFNQLPPASGISNKNTTKVMEEHHAAAYNTDEFVGQRRLSLHCESGSEAESSSRIGQQYLQPLVSSEIEACARKNFSFQNNLPRNRTDAPLGENSSHKCSDLQEECTAKFQEKEYKEQIEVGCIQQAGKVQGQMLYGRNQQSLVENQKSTLVAVQGLEAKLKDKYSNAQKVSPERANDGLKAKKSEPEKRTFDWDSLRKQACHKGAERERSQDTMDSIDWEAIRRADVKEISDAIRERGMNNMLAERIKEFLNRLVGDHGSIDLEWLRDVESDKVKDYLLSIRGLGLKSVECVRLLTLHHLAFPVDTNVGRICVRLGWVPLQPLPESLQLHLLELYPMLETIQKYLWPRLCKLDQRTLYELHYQMITFGKVFCTKSKPNCNACPMRAECKHFASAFASARLALPGPEEKGLVSSTVPLASESCHPRILNITPIPQLEANTYSHYRTVVNNNEPIIEEPATPEAEEIEAEESAIEDDFFEDPDEIPSIKLNFEEFTQNLQNYMQENNLEIQDADMSRALVAIHPENASIPTPKLKNVSRLRTEHQVYELPDSHPLIEGMDQREPDDPCPYLLAIWTPGETAQSTEAPMAVCNSQETGKLCDKVTCFNCNSIREAQAQTVRGTILIPCRTAMRGSFPLNGTYFQVNEVFADHDTSRNPIDVPRNWIWNLPRRTVYFGTSIPTIFKGLTTEGIQHCFWRGFVCVRGFDRTTRAPRPLYARLHFPASKALKNRKTAEARARE
ncbi:protein ROS1A-like isoform X1 [Typha latifolia]|uniref:protein ROS1A-like isoform X1 n=1 Tax=Typha latifolia TaxID=4733 RepID=UPI003C2E86A7